MGSGPGFEFPADLVALARRRLDAEDQVRRLAAELPADPRSWSPRERELWRQAWAEEQVAAVELHQRPEMGARAERVAFDEALRAAARGLTPNARQATAAFAGVSAGGGADHSDGDLDDPEEAVRADIAGLGDLEGVDDATDGPAVF